MTTIVDQLPQIAKGDVGLYAVDPDGGVTVCVDPGETIRVARTDSGLDAQTDAADRVAYVTPVPGGNGWTVLTFAADEAAGLTPFLDGLFRGQEEKEEIKADMESMYSSSLALMEEVSMVGDMLPKLPTGESEVDVVRMSLEALLVAASVESALFVRYEEQRNLIEVLVHVTADGVVATEFDELDPDGIACRAIRGGDEALLEDAVEGGSRAELTTPEQLARREVIAVPVRYGGSEKPVTLGALLLLDKRPNTYSNTDRFGSQDTKLATSVAAMLGSVLGTRKVAELGNEMRNAHVLHQQILPDGSPNFDGFDLAGDSVSPGAVGGDYYDFLQMPDGRMLCVVADVSGHNLASCLVMVSFRAALRLLASTLDAPGAVFDSLAATLFSDLSRTELFITAVCAAIEPGTGRMEICNAGHNPTMIYRARTGEVEEIFAEDTVLGFLPAPEHDVAQAQLEPNDVVLLYTDGVTEAENAAGEFLEEPRLREILKKASGGTAAEILAAVYGAVEDFADGEGDGDDISVLVIKVK